MRTLPDLPGLHVQKLLTVLAGHDRKRCAKLPAKRISKNAVQLCSVQLFPVSSVQGSYRTARKSSPLRHVPPRISALERNMEIERPREVVALIVRLLDQHAEVDQREYDVPEMHRFADPPVIEHQT